MDNYVLSPVPYFTCVNPATICQGALGTQYICDMVDGASKVTHHSDLRISYHLGQYCYQAD